MSLLNDYEELCNAQDVSIFKRVLDETLKPILISLEEKFFKIYMDINDVEIKLGNLRAEMYNVFDELKIKQETDIIEANN